MRDPSTTTEGQSFTMSSLVTQVCADRHRDSSEESVVGSVSCPLNIKVVPGFTFRVTQVHDGYSCPAVTEDRTYEANGDILNVLQKL